jgi:hypothetical protein
MADIVNTVITGNSIDVTISGSAGVDVVFGTNSAINVDMGDGIPGLTGPAGSHGTSGTSGTDGSSGTSGTDGSSGTSGTDGSSGTSGTDGSSGTSGTSGTTPDTCSYASSAGTAGAADYATSSGNSGTAYYSASAGSSGYAASAAIAGTSPYSGTADYSILSGTANYATSSGQAGTAVYATESGTSSFATSAGNAGTSDISGTASYATSSGNSGTALYAVTAGTAAFATSSGNAGTSDISGTASYATSAGDSGTALYAVTAGTSAYATSSGNSGTADYATIAGTANYATSAGQAGTSSAVGNIAAQSVLGNPTGSPAVASAITVAEQTLVGRITGGNVDDLSVAQVKTLLGNASESGVGFAELATVAEAIAGTDTSRIVTPAGNAASEAVIKNPLQMAQGIEMTYAASGSTGIMVADNNNIDFGTGNFTLAWKGMIPDYTPAADTILMQKSDGTNGWVLQVDTTGVLQLILNTTTYSSTVNPSLTDKTAHKIIVVVTRETASVAGSIGFYVDGVLLGASVAITAVVPTTVNNAVPLYVMGTSAIRSAGVCYFASVFNRALTAAEVLDLYRNGINFADKWGSQTAVYTSNFSAGVDGWVAARSTAAGNIDSIGGEDDWLRCTIDGTAANSHYLYLDNKIVYGKRYRATFKCFIPSTNAVLNGLALMAEPASTGYYSSIITTTDTVVSVSCEFIAQSNMRLAFISHASGAYIYNGNGTDVFYVKDIVVTEIGATLALEPEGIQPVQWLDSSTNKLHAMQPAAGASLIRRKKEFEIRWTNTWAGTHEAQYIGGLDQAILPVGCYIDSIIGVITGATIEDIIIGDGSDTDRWVAITTGLAAGTVSFAIANRISDGTNYKLVVDPDANFTGSIEWLIKGVIL